MEQEDEKNRNAGRDTAAGKPSPSPGSTPSKAEGEEADVEEALERSDEKRRSEQEKR